MGLRLKFNLVLLAVFVTGLAVTGYISYELLHRNAREEVLRNAGVMMEAALSMRSYTVGQVRPNLAVDPDKFLPFFFNDTATTWSAGSRPSTTSFITSGTPTLASFAPTSSAKASATRHLYSQR